MFDVDHYQLLEKLIEIEQRNNYTSQLQYKRSVEN